MAYCYYYYYVHFAIIAAQIPAAGRAIGQNWRALLPALLLTQPIEPVEINRRTQQAYANSQNQWTRRKSPGKDALDHKTFVGGQRHRLAGTQATHQTTSTIGFRNRTLAGDY